MYSKLGKPLKYFILLISLISGVLIKPEAYNKELYSIIILQMSSMTDIWLVYIIYIQVSTYCDHFCFLVCKPRNMQCPNVCQCLSKRKSYLAVGGLIGKQERVRGAEEKWCAFASEWEETGCSLLAMWMESFGIGQFSYTPAKRHFCSNEARSYHMH